MSHPHYKLTYFEARGAAEVTRFIFAYANVPYEDIRLPREQWQTLKPKTMYRQMPFLEIDGKIYGQSVAFARLVAKKYHLAGKTDEEQAHIDAVIDYSKDMQAAIRKFAMEKDEAVQAKLREEYFSQTAPEQLDVLQNQLKGDFFAASGVTYGDFAIATFLYGLLKRNSAALDKHPKLKAHLERVNNLPGIKEWIARRPVTEN